MQHCIALCRIIETQRSAFGGGPEEVFSDEVRNGSKMATACPSFGKPLDQITLG